MFSCVWLHFKKCFEKYFLMFGCVIENIIKNTFSTCCTHFLLVAHIFYLLLTFSQLPNEYIISFIPQNTNETQKKIIKFGHFAWSRSARRRDRDQRGWRFARSWSTLCPIAIEASCDRRFAWLVRCRWCPWTISASSALDDLYSLFFLSPSLSFFLPLSLSLALSLFCAWPGNGLKVKWKCKTISGSKALNFGQTEIIFRKFYFP